MKKLIAIILCLALFPLAGCGAVEDASSGKLEVIATLFPQYDFTRQIGGDKVNVTLLLPAGTESHTFDPSPSDMITISKSDLFIYTGDDMEPWAGDIAASVGGNTKILNASDNIDFCENDQELCIFNDVFEKGDKYTIEIYKIKINDNEQYLGIMPVPEKEIKKLDVKSKDHSTGVSVETGSSDVPLDTSVKAEDLTIKYKGFLKAYDIDLYSGIKDEYITQVKDGIIVRIPLPDEYDKKKLEIYHIKEDGTKGEKYKAIVEEIDGKKYAVFTTNHFSIYAIEEIEEIEEEIKDTGKEEIKDDIKEEIKQEETENPNTYDGIGSSIILLAISILGIIGIGLYLRKKERNEI